MKTFKATFEFDMPKHTSFKYLLEYLEFELAMRGDMKTSNPLSGADLAQLNARNLKIKTP